MEALFMKPGFETTRIVDAFTSFIWTDRYCGYGDFELRLPMTDTALMGIEIGNYVSIRESDHYMIVEKIVIESDTQVYAIISGRSLESILTRRIIVNDTVISGNIQNGILRLITTNAITPSKEARGITDLFFLQNADPNVTALTIEAEIAKGANLYDTICDICNYEHLGFRVIPYEDGRMGLLIYKGVNRSYSQEANPWIVFSTKYENLKSSEMTVDTTELKTTILEYAEYTETTYYTDAEGNQQSSTVTRKIEVWVGDDIEGVDRRETYKKSSEKPETIDESVYGTAEDRVNIRDYQTYELLYFDSAAYNRDCNKVSEKAASLYSSEPNVKWERIWLKPGDEGYIPEIGGSVGQSKLVAVDNTEAQEKANKKYIAYLEKNQPERRAYEVWGWVLSDEAGYNDALVQAQADIDAEIAAAKASALEAAKAAMRADGMMELANKSRISTFDGELNPLVQFKFGNDYYLGDEVQIVNEFNFQAQTRVVAMMFSEEEGVGYLAMPTFESDDEAVFEI